VEARQYREGADSGGACRFNASVLTQERKRQDETLSKDEAEAVSSSWLHGKKAWHDAVSWRCRLEEKGH
jgi:hypothetical protein